MVLNLADNNSNKHNAIMEEVNQRTRRKKSGGRRSSILKIKNPLIDLDPNQPLADALIPRKKARISSSRRVSFAETTTVKEFPRDSPHRWMPDPEDEDDSSPEQERLPSIPLHTSKSEIQGLDKLLTGAIQNGTPGDDNEQRGEYEAPAYSASNHTILQDEEMDMTDCIDKSRMIEDFQKPLEDDFGDNIGSSISEINKPQPSILDRIYVPEKKYSNGNDNHMYSIEKESDFRTLINTSINKYNMVASESLNAMAGTSNISVTSSVSGMSRKPLSSIVDPTAFKPIVPGVSSSEDIVSKPGGMIDGLSFLKMLGSKGPSRDDVFEDKTVMFDNNDMEETEVVTKCFNTGESGQLISDCVKVPSFLKSSRSFQSDDNKTMIFGKNNDMEQTEVLGGNIDFPALSGNNLEKYEEKTILLTNDMDETVPLKTKITSDLSFMNKHSNNQTVVFGQDNDMEQTQMIGGKIKLGFSDSCVSKTAEERTQLISNDMEETVSLTCKISTNFTVNKSSNDLTFSSRSKKSLEFRTDKTLVFEKGDEMEQTEMLTGKVQVIKNKDTSIFYTDRTKYLDNMDETGLLTGKIELAQASKLLEKNRTVLFSSDAMEETCAGNQLALSGIGKVLADDQEKQEINTTSKTELPVLSKNMKDEDTKLFDGVAMEETGILTQKIELPNLAHKFDSTKFGIENMEETKSVTSKIQLPSLTQDFNTTRSGIENDCMDETKGVTGKIEIPGVQQNNEATIYGNNDIMEETKAITGKIDVNVQEKNSTDLRREMNARNLAETINTSQYGNVMDLTQETKPAAGNIEINVSVHKSINEEREQKLSKTLDCKRYGDDNDAMEETKAVTGRIEVELSVKGNDENVLKCRLEDNLNDENEDSPKIEANHNVKELYNNLIKEKDLQDNIDTKSADLDAEVEHKKIDVQSEEKHVGKQFTEPQSTTSVGNTELSSVDQENIAEAAMVQEEHQNALGNLPCGDSKKTSESDIEFIECLDDETTRVTKGQKPGGMMSLIQKLRNDMNSGNDNEENSGDGVTQADYTDGFFVKYKSVFENMKMDASPNQNPNADIKIEGESIDAMANRVDKSNTSRRSIGFQSRTPLGKPFTTHRDACSEVRPQAKGSTIKLLERVAQTEVKVTPDGSHHQPLHCSKELFTGDVMDEARDTSPLPILECSMNITLRDRSRSEASDKANNSLVNIDLPSNSTNAITGITDEQLPMDMLTSSSIASGFQPDITGSSCESRSTIDCNVEEFLKQSMLNDTEGPMTVDSFYKRLQIPVPLWLSSEGKLVNSRRSIASLKKVDKETLSGKLEARYVHQPFVEVYSSLIEGVKDKLTSLKHQTEEMSAKILSDFPPVYAVAITGSSEEREEIRERLKILTKCCTKLVDRKWKEMKAECHEKFHGIIKDKHERLSEEVNQIVQASDDIQQELPHLTNAANNLESLLLEVEEKPLPTEGDIEFWNSSTTEIGQKKTELEKLKASNIELERKRNDLLKEKEEIESERLALKAELPMEDSYALNIEIKQLKDQLKMQTSLLEWHIENDEDDFITFLFDDDMMRLSINKQKGADNSEIKIASAHVRSLLNGNAKPVKKLMHSLALKIINNGTQLLESYNSVSLPELLHRLSQIVLVVRKLHRQISLIGLKYFVTVYEDFIVIEKWSLKTLRKVNIKLTFSTESSNLKLVPEVLTTMGKFSSTDIQKSLNSIPDGPDYLTRLCDSIDLDSLPNVTVTS